MEQIPCEKDIHYNYEYERAVLSICITFPETFENIQGITSVETFWFHDTRTVYEAMQKLWVEGCPIDTLTVNDKLAQQGIKTIRNDDTLYYLMQMSKNTPIVSNFQYYALRLRELYAKREMFRISHLGKDTNKDPFEQAKEIDDLLKKIFEIRVHDDWKDMSHLGVELLRHIEDNESGNITYISTGFSELDKMNGGFRAGNLVIIAARPSVGKSALSGKIALHNALKKKVVGYIPLEMDGKDVKSRMVSIQSGVEHWRIDRGSFTDDQQRHHVMQTISNMSELPIYMSDNPAVTAMDINVKAKKLRQRHGLDVLIIDYLQLITPDKGKERNREREVADMTRQLKLLAMQLGIPIILLAQLNRKSEERNNKKPQMSDLRESGAIEQDADVVILLHRDDMSGINNDEQGMPTDGQADLICCKWRNGSPVTMKIGFDKQKMKFYELGSHTIADYKEPINNSGWQQ